MRFRLVGIVLGALSLAACATSPAAYGPAAYGPATHGPSNPPPSVAEAAPEVPAPGVQGLAFRDLPGWDEDDHGAAFAAFRATCGTARQPELADVCARARAAGALDGPHARAFFEANFRAEKVGTDGMLTAYFAPEYAARSKPDAEFSAPMRARPSDLVTVDSGTFDPVLAGGAGGAMRADGKLVPYPDRTAIETRPAERVLAWMRPEDLFFLQIQGSGVLTFENGARVKANYAGNNGRRFVGVANALRDRGYLTADNTSGEAIRAWLAAHRGPVADEIMRLNPRYVFFSTLPDDGAQPVGAAGVPLPPGRAIAVDPARHAMGEVFWIDAAAPSLAGAFPAYRRLALALDTGGAIKGAARADLYLGLGPDAGQEAGRVRHVLRMYRLTPRTASEIGPRT